MANKKAKTVKKNRLGKPSEWSYSKWAVVLLVIGAALYLLFGYLPAERAQDAERKEFLQNKAQIEQIASKITSQYPTSEEKHDDYCAYTSVKFEKGERYCGVSIELNYKGVSLEKANEIAGESSRITGYELRPSQTNNSKEAQFVETNYPDLRRSSNDRQSLGADFSRNSNDCGMSLYYDTGTESNLELKIYITCQRDAKAEYFPLRKY